MVGIQKQVPVVNHGTANRGAAGIGVAPRNSRFLVHSRNELFHCLGDGVGTAEGPDNAPLGCRILLSCQTPALDRFRSGNLRPLADVVPVPIHSQDSVQAAERLIIDFGHVLAAAAAAWPVHQSGCFKGCRVTELNADQGCQFSCCGFIFVRSTCPVNRNDHTKPRCISGMFSGAVNRSSAPKTVHTAQDVLCLPSRNIVKVQGD